MAKICELCESPATTFCGSDQASLCWSCDYKVHSTNFLVARHSRNLLCQICQSLTSWSGSGSKLSPAISLCEKCSDGDGERDGDSTGVNDELEEMTDDDENEDCEYQVVPWSSDIPPPVDSCSSSDDDVADDESFSDIFASGKVQSLDLSSVGEDSGRSCKRKR